VAHVDADIVLIDEALSVGDVEFQAKCLTRMEEVSAAGATVIFISHDFAAVKSFCPRCIWIDGGRVRKDGPTAEVLAAMSTG
jgi:ABC-type polysaccharide/polyol phosphate transport system ATPase subunit